MDPHQQQIDSQSGKTYLDHIRMSMEQSKLVKTLKSLSSWELRHFRDFAYSPFYNKHEKVRKLTDLLMEAAPEFTGPEMERKQVFARLFPGEPYREQQFKDLVSQTTKLFRSFLVASQLKKDSHRSGMFLLEAYRQRHMDQEYLKQRKNLQKGLVSEGQKLQNIYLKEMELHEDYITYLSGTMSRSLNASLQESGNKLDLFYVLTRLKYGVEMANRKNVVGQEYDLGLLEYVFQFLEGKPEILFQHPEIQIYLHIYQCFTLPDPDPAFHALMEIFKAHGSTFPKPELREMFGYASNFCIKQINTGRSEFLPILIDLYRWALSIGAFFSIDGWLLQWDYKNIVSANLKAGEFDWCLDFIETYKEKIAPAYRENAYTYNLASYHFEQQDFRQALRLLQTVEFSDVFYALGSRVILLKSYFEMGDFDALNSLCESFKIYLKRNKQLSKYQFTIYFNLVGFSKKAADLKRKLHLLSPTIRTEKIEALTQKIRTKGNTAQAKWVLGKLDAMK